MDALTLWQPWATFVARGLKTVEIRTHRNYARLRGRRIAIHAGRRWDREGADMAIRHLEERGLGDGEIEELLDAARAEIGCVLATARVVRVQGMGPDDRDAALCDWDHTLVAYHLGEINRLPKPVPAKGRQGVWPWLPALPPGMKRFEDCPRTDFKAALENGARNEAARKRKEAR